MTFREKLRKAQISAHGGRQGKDCAPHVEMMLDVREKFNQDGRVVSRFNASHGFSARGAEWGVDQIKPGRTVKRGLFARLADGFPEWEKWIEGLGGTVTGAPVVDRPGRVLMLNPDRLVYAALHCMKMIVEVLQDGESVTGQAARMNADLVIGPPESLSPADDVRHENPGRRVIIYDRMELGSVGLKGRGLTREVMTRNLQDSRPDVVVLRRSLSRNPRVVAVAARSALGMTASSIRFSLDRKVDASVALDCGLVRLASTNATTIEELGARVVGALA